MTDSDKIESLIDSGSPENNYIAMQLMTSQLGFSFEEAYKRLKPLCRDEEEVSLMIGDIHVLYKVDLQRIIYASSSYADIERNIFFKGYQLPEYKKRLYSNDDSILSLGEFGSVDNLAEIKDDIIEIFPVILFLWEKMNE